MSYGVPRRDRVQPRVAPRRLRTAPTAPPSRAPITATTSATIKRRQRRLRLPCLGQAQRHSAISRGSTHSSASWVDEPTTIGEAFVPGNRVSANVIKTGGGVMQNHLLGDRLVTTFGRRKDSNFNRNAAQTTLLPDGITPNFNADDVWPTNWFQREGKTKTTGAVLAPLPRVELGFDRHAREGSGVHARRERTSCGRLISTTTPPTASSPRRSRRT